MCSIPGLPSPGSNVTVFITRVNVNPLCVLVEFWGNFVQDQRHAYQKMKKDIQCPKERFQEGAGKSGDLCLAWVNETWNRARIVSRNNTHYSIFLIDEGRTLLAPTSLLAWGQTEFFSLPPEVEFCILSNVLPLSSENRWSKLALEFIKSFCGKAVPARVLDFGIPQHAFMLDIPCLSREMHEMGFAKKSSNEEFIDFVLKSLQSDESLWTTSLAPESLELIKTQMCYMYPELESETTEIVLVTEVNNPLRVFCQLKVFSQELKKLTEQITQHYERTIGSHFARPENLGAPCASRGADGKWYRSVLQQVISNQSVAEVLHVDYGKKQFVQVDHIRPLAPEFFRMPVVTYVCSLHGVIDRGVGWTVSQIDYLKSLLLNRTVIAKFEYQSIPEGVHYVTLYGEENTNMNKLFWSREKCLIDSRCLKDWNMIGTCQSCHVSVKAFAQEMVDLKGFFTESLLPNTVHVAVVQHVESPSKFWIQTQKYAAEFDLLMNSLAELYSDVSSASGLIRKPIAGLLCVAKAKDDVFYRAAICEVTETKAEVFFLDYGAKELVDFINLRELPLGYQKLPALAIKCGLYAIKPRSEEWDRNATLFFAKAVVDKVLDVHVLAKTENMHLVQVFESMSEGEKDFSELLCNAGFGEMEVVDKPMVPSHSEVVQTSYVLKKSPVSQLSCSPVVTAAFKESFFSIGSSFDVTVSCVKSPNDFWCQKVNDAQCLKLLMQDLQRCYANSKFQPLLEAACVARHPKNRLWSRALIIQKHQNSNVTVLFVDYGETKNVPIHDLRRIDPQFLKLKGQAFRCCLYDLSYPVSHSTLVWSSDATLHFQEFVDKATSMSIPLKCTVYAVMCDIQNVVFNVVDLESPFQSICRFLVQHGLANYVSNTVAQPLLRLDTYLYSSHGIKTGGEENVWITCVKNVSHFFCQLQRNFVQINELAYKVNKLCNQLQSITCSKISGKVCFVRYTDGLWYRGQIKSKNPVVVHFVDYGDTQQVEESDLLPVLAEAAEIMAVPVQAVECRLSDLPEKVTSEVNSWFESFVTDRHLKALIVAKEPSGKLIVELYDGKTPVNAIIREKLHIIKVQQIAIKGLDVKEQYQSYNMSREKHWRSKKIANFEESSKSFQNMDMKREMKHKAQRESLCESVNVKPTVFKQAELPVKAVEPDLEAEVFISHCSSPLSFFVQLVKDEGNICSLVEKLNDGQSKHVPVNPADICEDDLVITEYPVDHCWYRAVVRKVLANDLADVEFIDFGNTAEVSLSKICILDKMFLQPRYSIHCSLTGGVNVDTGLVSNFKNEIEKNTDGFLCKFIQQSSSVWEVSLEVSGMLLGSALSKDTNIITISNVPKSPDTDFEPHAYTNSDISIGQIITAYASVIIGPHVFWCQYAETGKLQEISDRIQKFGSYLEFGDMAMETLPIGSGCIALFDEDHLWYRAKVILAEKDSFSVVFVDYGNESKVKICNIRPLPLEVSEVPPQAFACQLDGFNSLEGSWDEKAANQFFELISDQLLKVTILKLGSLCDMTSPHLVKLECKEVIINDAMKKFWTQNRTSFDPANAPTVLASNTVAKMSSPCETESVVRLNNSLCVATDNGTCISPLALQVEPNGALAEHEERHGSKDFLDKKNVALVKIFPQDEDHDLNSADNECVSVKDTNVNADSQPSDSLRGHLLDFPDFINKGMFTGSKEYMDKNKVEPVKTLSPEDKIFKNMCVFVSEQEESKAKTENQIIKSDMGNIRRDVKRREVGSVCVIWSHVYKRWCRAETLKIFEDSTLVLLLDYDLTMLVDPMSIYEIVPDETLQTQDSEYDSCLCVMEAMSGKHLQPADTRGPDVVPYSSQERSQMVVVGAALEQSIADPKLVLFSAIMGQVQTEELSPPSDEQKEYMTETCEQIDELMEVIPVIHLKKVEETEHNTVECFSSPKHTAKGSKKETDEQPSAGVDLNHEEQSKMLVTDVSVEQSALEMNPALEVAQDLSSALKAKIDADLAGTELFAANTVSSDLQKPSDVDNPRASTVTHLTLRIEDTSDDNIFVKELQASPSEACKPSTKE
ncbi:tudor domain-containing 6 [Clarias gariepinus]